MASEGSGVTVSNDDTDIARAIRRDLGEGPARISRLAVLSLLGSILTFPCVSIPLVALLEHLTGEPLRRWPDGATGLLIPPGVMVVISLVATVRVARAPLRLLGAAMAYGGLTVSLVGVVTAALLWFVFRDLNFGPGD